MLHQSTVRSRRRIRAILGIAAISAVLGQWIAVPAIGQTTSDSGYGHQPEHAAQPDAAKAAGALLHQQLTWGTCTFPAPDLAPERRAQLLAVPGLACATITVPRDWHHPQDGNTITLRISKTKTSTRRQRQGIALVNPGGPGGTGLEWGAGMALRSPKLAQSFDFIGFDPRGVGQSTPLLCTYVIPDPTDLVNQALSDGVVTDKEYVGLTNLEAPAVAKGCQDNPLTKYINTEQTAWDMDFIRALLGEKKMSYVGFSYGTWLGAWYAKTFPEHSQRILLDSSTNVSAANLQPTWDQQPGTRDRQFQELMLPYIARHDSVYHLGKDPMAIRRQWEAVGGSRGGAAFVFALIVLPAMYKPDEYPAATTLLVATIKSLAAEKAAADPAGSSATEQAAFAQTMARKVLAQNTLDAANRLYLEQRLALLNHTVTVSQSAADGTTFADQPEAFDVIRCNDGDWQKGFDYWYGFIVQQRRDAPLMAPFNTVPACAYWPKATVSMPKAPSNIPKILMVQHELDAATAYDGALAGFEKLPNAAFISVDNGAEHGVYPNGTSCVDDKVETYMTTGQLPSHRTVACQATPIPDETHTYQTAGRVTRNGTIRIDLETPAVRKANKLVQQALKSPDDPNWNFTLQAQKNPAAAMPTKADLALLALLPTVNVPITPQL